MRALADEQLSEILLRIEARTPAPASGSAAAIVCATAAALTGMVAAYQGETPAVAGARERAAALRARALALAQLDISSYEPVLAALRLPGSAPEREAALARALVAAAEVPLQIAEAAAEVAELAAGLARGASSHALGDAATAATLAEAACRAAVALVEVNLRDANADEWRAPAASLAHRAAAARAGALGLASG
jgi:formiminotetrahydrofolate cyclodeaminase